MADETIRSFTAALDKSTVKQGAKAKVTVSDILPATKTLDDIYIQTSPASVAQARPDGTIKGLNPGKCKVIVQGDNVFESLDFTVTTKDTAQTSTTAKTRPFGWRDSSTPDGTKPAKPEAINPTLTEAITNFGIRLDKSSVHVGHDITGSLKDVTPINKYIPKVTWSTDNTAVLYVRPDGSAYALKAGTAKLIATIGSVVKKIDVKVSNPKS